MSFATPQLKRLFEINSLIILGLIAAISTIIGRPRVGIVITIFYVGFILLTRVRPINAYVFSIFCFLGFELIQRHAF